MGPTLLQRAAVAAEPVIKPALNAASYVGGIVPGVAESLVGGMVGFGGQIASGVTGTGYSLASLMRGEGTDAAGKAFYKGYEGAQGLLERNVAPLLEPETRAGQDINKGFEYVARGVRSIGEFATDLFDSPIAGAVTEGVAQAIGIPAALGALTGAVPLVGSNVAALMARAKQRAEAPAARGAGAGAGETRAQTVADQMKAVRPEPPAVAPETPTAGAVTVKGEGIPKTAGEPRTPAEPALPVSPEAVPKAPEVVTDWQQALREHAERGATVVRGPERRGEGRPVPAAVEDFLREHGERRASAFMARRAAEEAGQPVPEAPMPEPPAGAPTFAPKPGDAPGVPRHAVGGLPIQEIPISSLKLSEDVPQFKGAADEKGIVSPLGGKFDRTGVAPIQVWERKNGDMEVISGRHRLELAQRSGEPTIPSQVHREVEGFDQDRAAALDATLNIRDEQGSVADYANYFKATGIPEEAANAAGLLARAKGRTGFAIARDASDDIIASHSAGLLSDEAAHSIARAAPGNAAVQAKIDELKQEQNRLTHWPLYPDLVAAFRKGAEAAAEKPAAAAPVDRRLTPDERRKRYEGMSPEELQRELEEKDRRHFTSSLTGLPNRAAYEAAPKMPLQAFADLDNLKEINDNLGHPAGDAMIKELAGALKAETQNAFHISGDEFYVQGETAEGVRAIMERVRDRLAEKKFEYPSLAGETVTRKGMGFSYGIGEDLVAAEKQLHADKAARRERGLRAERDGGEAVRNIVNLNIGITPSDMAKSMGALADLARGVVDRAKETKLGAAASEWLNAVTEDLQTKIVPMAAGTDAARAIAKDFANADRLSRWQWSRFDDLLKKNYTPEQRAKMWDAAEDENLIRTQKLSDVERQNRGLSRLTPEERATMDTLHEYGEQLLQRAKDVGLFRGEGVEYWSPRIVTMIGADGQITTPKSKSTTGPPSGPSRSPYTNPAGGNITTTASSLKQRKYLTAGETEAAAKLKFGEGAAVVRDIRTMPMAMARIERAIAGKELINAIKEFGKTSGQDLVVNGAKDGYFTIDHPAFKIYRYRPDIKMTEAWDKHMWDNMLAFADDIGVETKRVASMRGRAWGKAYEGKPAVVTRFGGPETILTHELGHQLDFKYGLVNKFFGGDRPVSDFILKRQIVKAEREGNATRAEEIKKQMSINGEMRDLSDLRFEGIEATDYYKKYVRKGTEKIANMVHAYVHAPEKFKAVAPTAYAEFTRFMNGHPELARLNQIKPSLTLEAGGFTKRPPGADFDVSPIYVSKEFEGPLKSIMSDVPGKLYSAMMDLKGKTMGVIMYSPLIHNGVEWGRALPLMPGKIITFKAYFDGNVAKNDPEIMSQAIKEGLVPIGHRFFMQDITGIMEDPSLQPGRSWTAKLAGGAVGLINKGAGEAVKRGVDTAGDFWHNTLLWDRVGDLQMGIYAEVKADLIKKGMGEETAGRIAAHFGNRYAGALPNESMSALARNVANFSFFSRTFTFGNLGVMKDMMTGLPRDVQAQIARDAGEVARFAAKGTAQATAIKAFSTDIALMYGMNSALQSGFDAMKRDQSLDEIAQGYVDRFDRMVKNAQDSPSDLLKPFAMLESLTPLSENEPGKEYRVLYDYEEAGTGVYVRLPTGKIGEEFLSWATSPLDILKRKEGTIARPLIQMVTNDKGFGRRVYNPDLPGFGGAAKAVGNIAWNVLSQQFPTDSLNAAIDMVKGDDDKINALKVVGPLFGLTFSKGAPGGPEIGEMFTVERRHRAEVSEAMPDIKKLIKRGDMDDAIARMYEAHMTPEEIKATIRFSNMPRARLTPRALKKFYQTAPPEERERMDRMREQ
jgi:diguanylate cyclase (GGDEF)-like protein